MTIVTGNEPQPELNIRAFPGADDYDPVAALVSRWQGTEDPNKARKEDPEEAPEGDQEAPGTEDQGDGTEEAQEGSQEQEEEGKEEASPKEALKANDDDEIEVQVGDETRRVTVADLKALVAQKDAIAAGEAAAKTAREAADNEARRYAEGLDRASKMAADNWAEYEKIDFLAAQQAMSPAEFAALKENSKKAWETHQFYQKEKGDFIEVVQTRAREELQVKIEGTRRALTDPTSPFHIEGWSEPVYNDIRGFLVEQGAPVQTVNMLVEPWALKIAHLALKASKASKAVAELPKPKPVVKTSATPQKTTQAPARDGEDDGKVDRAISRLRNTGNLEDAAALLASRWTSGS